MPFNPNDFNLSIEIKVVNLVSCSVIELVFFPAREKKKRAGGEGNCRLSLSLSLPRLFACLPGWLAPSGGSFAPLEFCSFSLLDFNFSEIICLWRSLIDINMGG